jgi:hypothetical protein
MRVVIALAVLAVSLSVVGCSRPYREAHAKPLPPLPPHPVKASPLKTPPLRARTFPEDQSPMPPKGRPNAAVVPSAAPAIHYVTLDTGGNCAMIDSKPSADSGKIIGEKEGYASLESANKALKDCKAKYKSAIGAGALPTIIDTVRGIANALDLGKTDQAVGIAKAYVDNLRVNVGKYYRSFAADRLPLEQAEAEVNLVPGIGLFDSPEQGIANLKVLRQGIENELVIDETNARNNKFAEDRVLNARRLIRAIGTDEDLDNALANMDTLRDKREWADVVKMLTDAVEQEAAVKFKAAQAKAKQLGGVHKLTREDIDGLSDEQIKQLRGY